MKKLLILAAAATVATACDVGQERFQYVRTDTALCTFRATDNEPLTIRVEASDEWQAEALASWLEVGEKTQTSFVLTVKENESYSDQRESTVELTCGKAVQEIRVIQLAHENDLPTYRMYASCDMGAAMSPNGVYAYGTKHVIQPDESFHMYATFFNLDTGETTEVGPMLYGSPLMLEKPTAVTDQGTAFIYGPDLCTVAISADGDYFYPEVPAGCQHPNVEGVSADGRYWVGFCDSEPTLWEDGVPRLLPKPERNYRGNDAAQQVMARGVSHDGSVIYGTQWDNGDYGMVYWKDGKVQPVGKDIYKVTPTEVERNGAIVTLNVIERGIYATAEHYKISPGGKWIAGTYYEESIEDGFIRKGPRYAAFYNTETERTTVFTDYPDCKGITVTDDGIGIIAPKKEATEPVTSGFVVEIETGAYLGTCLEYIRDTFGITVSSGYISYIPPCGNRLLGTMQGPVGSTQFTISPRPVK